jgi:ParB family chromosome partitioning protein
MPTTVEPTLEMIDPATLLVDLNIREAKLDKDFVASIKDHGVIEPIVAVRSEDGQLRVRHGHRRALGAIEAEQPLVPVVIARTEDNDDADRREKLRDIDPGFAHRTWEPTSSNSIK